jgi:hypothetical protein
MQEAMQDANFTAVNLYMAITASESPFLARFSRSM